MARYTNESIVHAAMHGQNAETSTGNMSTVNRTGMRWIGGTGQMPKSWARLISDRAHDGAVLQVIRSYATPIAWLDRDYGWIVPIVTYSITTSSKHQTHLYRLRGRHIYMPHDATPADAERVLAGKMVFNGDRNTYPGPNYVAGE